MISISPGSGGMRLEVNPAFRLIETGPSTCPFVHPGSHRLGTRHTSDAWIPGVVELVVWNFVQVNIAPDVVRSPLCQRIDFDYIVGGIPFYDFSTGPAP
jgi:hypothetical protein